MPMINLFPVLTNSYNLDTFSVVRRQETVSNFGISTVTSTTIAGQYGVVKPSNENDLKRLPDTDIFEKAITVITMFPLRGESETAGSEFKPDLVVWNGDNFMVREVLDYSNYAMGFVKAICTSIDRVDQPPQGGPEDAG